MSKLPLGDMTPYEKDPESRTIAFGLADGSYIYVQDTDSAIHVLPDGPHRHPKVLGGARPVSYAGDLTILGGRVKDVTNLSGIFQFDDARGLLAIAETLECLGFDLLPDAVRFFPLDASRTIVLR